MSAETILIWISQFCLTLVATLLFAIIVHEFGHFAYFQLHTDQRTAEIRMWRDTEKKGHPLLCLRLGVGHPVHYRGLSNQQLAHLYLWGIVAGFIPIVLSTLVSLWVPVAAVPLYVFGCKKDIWNLSDVWEK